MLNRRELLTQGALAAGAASAATIPAPLLAADQKPDWALGLGDIFSDVPRHGLTRIHGRAPHGLVGTLYRNGPARFRRGGSMVDHWFDGDGLVRAWQVNGNEASLAARFVDTPKRRHEESVGRIVQPGFGTSARKGHVLSGPDDANAANTNVIAAGDRLLALWEAGSAFELDPVTLETRGTETFKPELASMPFLAHPRVEPSGRIWNLGISGERAFVWRLAANGRFEAGEMIRLPMASYIHDFTATERHLVIVCQPWIQDSSHLPYVDSLVWQPERATRVLVIDKDDLSKRREYELPPLFFFHLGDAWEESDGTIRFDGCFHADPAFATNGAPALLHGRYDHIERPELMLVALHADGKTKFSRTGITAEFPRSAPHSAGLSRQSTIHVGGFSAERPFARSIGIWNWDNGRGDQFDFGARQLVEEFVPVGDYLLGTTLNLDAEATELHLIDARRVSDGPVVSWRSELPLPLSFHGNWAGETM